jgi:hypothetical protein
MTDTDGFQTILDAMDIRRPWDEQVRMLEALWVEPQMQEPITNYFATRNAKVVISAPDEVPKRIPIGAPGYQWRFFPGPGPDDYARESDRRLAEYAEARKRRKREMAYWRAETAISQGGFAPPQLVSFHST